MNGRTAAVALLFGFSVAPSRAAEEAVTAQAELLWESSARAKVGIQVQVVELWDALYELKRGGAQIITRKAVLASESSADQVSMLTREKLYVAMGTRNNLPDSLSLLICELNAQRCTVRQEGSKKPLARWAKLANVEIDVPDLRLEQVPQVQTYEKRRGDRISTIVTKERLGCVVFDAECEARVRHLNPDQSKLRVEARGTILVPAVGYTARMPLTAQVAQDIAKGNIVQKYGVTQKAAEAFISNAIAAPPPAIKIQKFTEPIPAGSTTLSSVLKLIKYKPIAWGPNSFLSIGLVDSKPDLEHCALNLQPIIAGARIFEFDNKVRRPIKSRARTATPCGRFSSLPVADDEHGTHLLGLWFASKNSPSGEGMLPSSDRVFLGIGTFVYGVMQRHGEYARIGRIVESMGTDVGVINLSWGIPASVPLEDVGPLTPRTDNVGIAISRLGALEPSPVLFVAAAGNNLRPLNAGACDLTPVCPEGRANVLTVTALDNSADDPDVAGNYGRPVDIGVPAVNVMSTLRNDLIGKGTGSSQAAAVASASAAMLMMGRGLYADQARNRLIYTSDLTSKLQAGEGKLFGGRLNFERAAATSTAQIAFDAKARPANVLFGGSVEPTVRVIVGSDTARIEEIRTSNIRRLVRKAGRDPNRTHTIFYVDVKTRRLARLDGALDASSRAISVTVSYLDGRPKAERKLGDVVDYTSAVPRRLD